MRRGADFTEIGWLHAWTSTIATAANRLVPVARRSWQSELPDAVIATPASTWLGCASETRFVLPTKFCISHPSVKQVMLDDVTGMNVRQCWIMEGTRISTTWSILGRVRSTERSSRTRTSASGSSSKSSQDAGCLWGACLNCPTKATSQTPLPSFAATARATSQVRSSPWTVASPFDR